MAGPNEKQAREEARAGQSAAPGTAAPRFDTTFHEAQAPAATPAFAPPDTERPARRGPRTWTLAAIAAGVIAATVGSLVTSHKPDPRGDALSAQQIAARLQAFQAHGALRLPSVSPAEQHSAVATMLLAPAEQAALERDLAAKQTRLVVFTLWDDVVEDNDVVEVQTDGFSRVVALTKAPQKITVPVPIGAAVVFKGVRDGGGGGITVAALSDGGALPLPFMSPGEVRAVAVTSP